MNIDGAKFGYLYLKDGHWDGKQLIPENWVLESTKEQVELTGPVSKIMKSYGYQWWIQPFGFQTSGHNGQFIFVIPDQQLVVVFTSDFPIQRVFIPVVIVKDKIIPAVKSIQALPENKKAVVKLNSEIKKFGMKTWTGSSKSNQLEN